MLCVQESGWNRAREDQRESACDCVCVCVCVSVFTLNKAFDLPVHQKRDMEVEVTSICAYRPGVLFPLRGFGTEKAVVGTRLM